MSDIEFYKNLFDSYPDSLIILDTSFSILSINNSAEEFFQISRKKATGKKSSYLLDKQIEQLVKKAFEEERTVFGEEITSVLINGEKVTIQAIASPGFNRKGEIERMIVVIRNLQGIQFLSRKDSQKISTSKFENLILGLAHELKNPLSGIRGAAQILGVESDKNSEDAQCAQIIIKEVDRLNHLLEKLKDLEPFAKETFQYVDIHEILMDLILLETKSIRKGIEIKHDFDVTVPTILGDENSLKQVFLNILKNSIQAIGSSGNVNIKTRWNIDYKLDGQNSILIEFNDDGEGIPKDNIDKLYSPFFTTKKDGSGMGLFLSYQLIAKHGGAIFIESEEKIGTSVKIYLPTQYIK